MVAHPGTCGHTDKLEQTNGKNTGIFRVADR
jgi:hypothetical protein